MQPAIGFPLLRHIHQQGVKHVFVTRGQGREVMSGKFRLLIILHRVDAVSDLHPGTTHHPHIPTMIKIGRIAQNHLMMLEFIGKRALHPDQREAFLQINLNVLSTGNKTHKHQ